MLTFAKPKLIPAEPKLWHQGFLDLRPSVVPCPSFTLEFWGSAHEAYVEFLDLLGVHPDVGTIRPDFRGVIK
ncbi:hypothetical protein [Methylobacterium sp. V23]|uniref:hypothetical protein n=1 Tax=Methylobacterium sp. V23 TaxID=2044878 RepID=UPI000CDA538E|nr:hypothetical protein [Methylobacterium sp. V23]POR42583.1 hypothetical protein CRT23_12400 [Methylobacterium sp. V23]